MRGDRFLPEEGVMLDADLPQPLGSSVVGKLKANCTFKLLILAGRGNMDTEKYEEKVRAVYSTRCLLYFAEGHISLMDQRKSINM